MPNSYPAWICKRLSDDLSGIELGELACREPGPAQALIQVRAAALNFPDLLMSQGAYQHKPELPFVPGMEAAGVISAVGSAAAGYQTGERVYFGCRSGALAQQVIVPVDALRRLPSAFDFAEGAAFQVGAITAFVGLVRRGHLQAGETLLVHGASGGMGMAAVQLGKHLGATVIATGTDPAKLAVVRQAGADHVIAIGAGAVSFRENVKALTAGKGADVVFDPVGGDVFDESTRCIAWGGRLLVIGFASGRIATVSTNMALIKGFSVIGVRAGEAGRRDPAQGIANNQAIYDLASNGLLRPHIGARFAFADSLQALRALRDRQFAGKLVIES